ncbi:hypothetical protein [Anaerobutyricum hallii]
MFQTRSSKIRHFYFIYNKK